MSDIISFWNNGNFESLTAIAGSIQSDPSIFFLSPLFIVWLVLIIVFVAYKPSRRFGKQLLVFSPLLLDLFVTVAVIKNQGIGSIPPFLMMAFAIFLLFVTLFVRNIVLRAE